MVVSLSPVAVPETSDFAPASSKEFLDIQATAECGFTLKRVLDVTRTQHQLHLRYSKVRKEKFNHRVSNLKRNVLFFNLE